MNRRLAALIAVMLVLAAGGTVLITANDDNPAPAPQATATPDALPEGAERKAPDGTVGDLGSNLREETGIAEDDAAKNDAIGDSLAPVQQGDAAGRSIAPPCRTDFSGGVWSSRNGVTPTMFVLHYTVSQNRPGWGDVEAIENFFSTVRQGSSHFIVDFEGHCLKIVRGTDKAWTQGNANPWALSVEIIATGSESNAQWRASPLIKDKILARLVRSVMDAHGLPVRRVDPVGCVFPAGWTDHFALECGNFHTDVRPHFPFRVFGRQLRAVR